jgi:hypothetical protein
MEAEVCAILTFTAEDDVWLASLSEAAGGRGTRRGG